jgi:hypothetical protein
MACLFKQHFVASLSIPKFCNATGSKFRSGTDEKFRGPTDRFHGLIQIPYASRGESLLTEQQARALRCSCRRGLPLDHRYCLVDVAIPEGMGLAAHLYETAPPNHWSQPRFGAVFDVLGPSPRVSCQELCPGPGGVSRQARPDL